MKTFEFELKDGVGTITLNRPEKINALTFETYRELTDFFASKNPARVLLIRGKGRGFCSGGDVNEIIGPLLKMDARGLLEFTRMTCELVRNIRLLRKPVVAAVHGACAGAGAVIATACDVRLAAEDARFAFLFTRIGLSGADMGAAYLLPRIVGFGRAAEILLTGRFFDAAEAQRIGFVSRLCPPDRLAEEAGQLAAALARGPAFGLGMTKEMMNRELSLDLEAALEWEAQAQAICMQTPDFHEAHRAFVEKREPRFE
jgi:enoyl-CoA hydratase/carnithine racemase